MRRTLGKKVIRHLGMYPKCMRKSFTAALVASAAMFMSGCGGPGSVHMSRPDTSYAQTKADWDACVEQVKNRDSDPAGQLGAMIGELLWGAPFTKDCMKAKGYTEDD